MIDGCHGDVQVCPGVHGGHLPRSRASTGLSMRSRRASRAEYHDDLKPAIRHVSISSAIIILVIIVIIITF